MAGLVYLDNNIWRYENAGTADLLSVSGTTLTGLDATQAKNGIAFYQTKRTKCFDIPATSEIWIKFDVYTTLSKRWRAYNQLSNSTGICSQTSGTLDFWVSDNNVQAFSNVVKNQLQTILLHMVSNSSAGVVEAWIDGDRLYTYNGNVDNGSDFADIYLQSDGSGTFFSNVIISNAQIDINDDVKAHPSQYVIAPEIFVSVKPIRGFIGVKPEIYTVIDCTPVARLEVTTADTKRVIVKTENVTGDTLRKVSKTESVTGDTIKIIKAYEQATADTLRIIMQGYEADEIAVADTLRRVLKSESTIADTLIRNAKSEVATADTLRIVNNVDIAIADTCRLIVERATADTCRQIVRVENAVADTVIRVPHILRYVIEHNPVALRGTKSLRNTPAVSLINSFKDAGITAFNITLNEKTLSDNFQLETTHPMEITDAVKGQLLDYPFSFLVEETSQRDFVQTVKGMYDVDKLLYTQFFIPPKIITGESTAETKLDSAADYIQKAADYLGFTSNILIDDFTPYQDFSSSQTTYRDLLSAVFGWTSRLPQRQINVFIRGNTLHCIQRGKETSTFDISNLPHSRPTINKSLIRSLWNKPNPDDDSYSDDDNQVPFSGNISYSTKDTSVSLHYDAGLLTTEKSVTDDGKTKSSNQSSFTYWKDAEDIYYIDSKSNISSTINYEEETLVQITSTTEYTYRKNGNDIFLYQEVETIEKAEYEYDTTTHVSGWTFTGESSTSVRQTLHTPVGNGWYAQTVYVDGEPQGSNVSQGKPSNTISLYTVKSVRRAYGSKNNSTPDTYEDWRRRLSAIADTSFPVRELDLIQDLTNALLWLNRKIQVDVSVDLISPVNNGIPAINHIVDFTERVILDGDEYFLVSNQIEFTPHRFIQHLNLIRWYAQ